MHLEQILKNLPLGVGTPYQKTGLNIIQELGNIASVVDAKKKCDELSATPAGGV
jgi:hypothetical protein